MISLKKPIIFLASLFFLKSYGQNIAPNSASSLKSYLVIRATKDATTSVVINNNNSQSVEIEAGSAKIIPVEPGNYTISLFSAGTRFDTAVTVLDHASVLKKNPKQTSVRYTITPPNKPSISVAGNKKNNESKKIEPLTNSNNLKIGSDIDLLKKTVQQSFAEFEVFKTGKELKIVTLNNEITKGSVDEVAKTKTLFQLKNETTSFIESFKSEIQVYDSKLKNIVNDFNSNNEKLQKLKADNDATKLLFDKMLDVQKNITELQKKHADNVKNLSNAELIFTPKLQGFKPMSESLDVAIANNRTDDFKFFVTSQNINNIKINSKNIIFFLIDEKANYETFLYFLQQGLDVNDFNSYLKIETNIYASPIMKACIKQIDINTIELMLKKGAKICPTLTFPDKKKANNQYLYNLIKNNNSLLLLFIKYGFSFK